MIYGIKCNSFPSENNFSFSLVLIGSHIFFAKFALISSTYRDAEVVKLIAVIEFFCVVVLVRREKLTKTFIVDIPRGLYIDRKTWRSFQTVQGALWHAINETFTKGSDIQVGEFMFLEVCITEGITSAYSNLWHF